MTACNFQVAHPDIADFDFCDLTRRKCAGADCILQRILAALPLTASPIVAQGLDAMGTGPGDTLPYVPATVTITGGDYDGRTVLSQKEAAEVLGISVPHISTISKRHDIGQKTTRRKMYTPGDIEQLRSHLKGGHKKGGPRGPYKKALSKAKHQAKKEILAERSLTEDTSKAPTEVPNEGNLKPDPPPCAPDLAAVVLKYYRTYDHIKISPDVVAMKIGAKTRDVQKVCEQLNEDRKLCYAGQDGYYSKDPLPLEEL